MSYDDDDNDDRFGHDSHGRGHGAPSPGGRDTSPTSDFSTMLLSDDGRFLGMKLPPELAKQARTFFPSILPWLSDAVEKKIVPEAEKIAVHFGNNPQEASRIGGKVGNAAAYLTIFSSQALNLARNSFDSAQRVNDMNLSLRPLAKSTGSHSIMPLTGNNEVVANLRAKISNIFWQKNKEILVSAISSAPAAFMRWGEQKAKNHVHDTQREFSAAKGDVDKQAEILEREITVGSKAMGFDPREMEAAKERMIENKLKAYEANYKAFETANKTKIKSDLNTLVNELELENYRSQFARLKRFGVNTDPVYQEIEDLKRYHTRSSFSIDAKDVDVDTRIRKVITDFKNSISRGSDKKGKAALEEVIKAQYVRKEGAFNREWLEYSPDYHDRDRGRGHDKPLTHEDEINQKIAKIEEARLKAEQEEKASGKGHGKDEKSTEMVRAAAGLAGGIVGEMFTAAIGGEAREKQEQPLAFDRIMHLRRSLEKAEDGSLEQVPGIAIGKDKNDKDMGYAQYVHEIFQQHQKDCKRTEIGERFVEGFEKAHWDDAAIQQLSDEELNPYEFAIKTLSKRIKDGRMDAIALIDLVGNRQVKLVHDDGRSFGPRGAGKDDAAIKAAILKVIDEKTALLHAGKEQTDEQINDKLGNFVFSVEDMKKALASDELEKSQRAFVFTLFSDVVGSDEKLCGKLGISDDRCKALRKETTEQFSTLLDAAVATLAEMIEQSPDMLEKSMKLTDKEKQLITSLAERSGDEHKHVLDNTENAEERKMVETVAANAMMSLKKSIPDEDGKPQTFWQRVVAATRRPKKAKSHDDAPEALANDEGGTTHPGAHERKNAYDNRFEGDASADSPDLNEKTRETLDWTKGNGKKEKSDSFADREYKSESARDLVEKRRSPSESPYAGIAN